MDDVTPLDVLGAKFSKRLHGYEPQEVHELLSRTAGTLEKLLRERGDLRQQVHALQHELAEFREREHALQDALVAAQHSAERTIEAAREEGQKIVAEAQALADRLVQEANDRTRTIETVIADLRARRREVRAELMRLAELLKGLIHDDQMLEKQERTTPRLALMERPKSDASGA